MKLAKMLREAREKHGWSLSEAARQLGCAKAHLHQLEHGISANPRLSTLASFVIVYGLKPSALIETAKEFGGD